MPTPAPNTYPFDGSGTAATNLVSNEPQSLTLTNYRDYNFVIPNFAPFYADSLKVKHRETITSPLVTLTEGIDYYPALSFVGASRATAKPVYGAISFTNLKLTGFLEITYQTVGGEWTLSVQKITELAANVIYNPRTTTWETLVNVPAYFPPLDHAWQLDDLVGQKEVLAGLDSIEKAILNKDSAADLLAHATNFSNPHRTSKAQVGLAKVMNYSPATMAEAVEARRNDLYATPAGVKAFIDSLGLDKDLSFVSLEEVVTRKSVPKILTFDLFLEYMKLYGGAGSTAPIETGNIDRPIVIYPQELDNFLKGQPFKCTTYVDAIPGTITRIMDLTGNGTHTIPKGTNTVSITGRGGIGTEYVANFVVKTKTVSGMGSGSFIVPAGGNILSLRGRGAPGFISNDIGVYKPTNNGTLINLPTPVVNPGDPTWTYELVSKFSSNYVINAIMNSIVLTIDLKKNYSNNLSVVSNNVPCTLLLTNKSSDGILLTYKGTFTTAFSDSTLLSAEFELKFERLPGTNISSGNDVTVTINTATIKFPGSTDLLSPNARIDDITLNPNVNAVISYSSPAGTELDIIYQDFTNTGEWKISKYYSSKITNSSTGSSSLVEDTIGNVVVLPLAVTGEYMIDKNSITLDASPVLSTPQTLTLVASESSSNKRVFENIYTIGGTIVSVKVISEYVLNTGLQSKGPSAMITVFNSVHKFEGSPDNDTLPITRTDDIILDINSATTVTYNCPTGASIVLEYKEPNAAQPIAHSDTEWEVSKADSFVSANILDSTVLGKGSGFSLTTWKPTHQDTFINNSDYYVRCRWVKSDATKSDWSDTRKFIFSVGAVNQPKDKELSRWCIGLDQWGTYADGNGGSYDRVISSNSVACGFVAPEPTGAQANTITVQLLSDLNVAYNGHNVIFTAVVGNTKAGTVYECELQQKYITESDYNYSKVNVNTITSSFTGDANSTTLKFGLAYSAIGAGNRVFKYRVSQSGFPVNTAVSTPININFSTPVTDNPIPTGPTPSTSSTTPTDNNLKLTLTSSRTDIRIGDNEVLTVMLTGGIPGEEYQLLMITKNSTRLNDNGTTSLIRITANNSGTGTFTKDGGNDGSIPLGLYFTVVETLGRPVKVSSGTLSRNFLGAYTNPRIVCSIVGSADIDIGESRTARADITGFEPSKTYTLRWYRTLPNSSNRTVWNLNGSQITTNVVTSASGTGSIEIVVSNDGTLDPGAWRFDVDAYDSSTNALVPTPGGNQDGVYNILVNTSISILSNISESTPIYTNTTERITYIVTKAAANRTLNLISSSRFVSGNTARINGTVLDTNASIDTVITITTGSDGSGTTVKEYNNNNNNIPGGSVWTRQATLIGTSTVSNILKSKYANSAIAFKLESARINSGNNAINKLDPDTISYGLTGLQADVRYTIKWLYKVNTGQWIAASNIADIGFNSTSDRYSTNFTPLILSPNNVDQTHTLYMKAVVYDNNNNPTESNELQWNYTNPSLQAFSPSLTSVKNGTAITRGTSDSITLNMSNVKQSRYSLTWYMVLDSTKSPIFNGALPTEVTPTATTFNGSYTLPIDVGSVAQPRTLKYGVDIVEVVTNTTRSPVELSYTYSDQNNSFTIGISCSKQSQQVTRNSTDVINIVIQNITPNANYDLRWYYQIDTGAKIPLNDPLLPTKVIVNSSSTTINQPISIGYGISANSIINLRYYVDIVDSNNTVVSSATPSGVSWMFNPAIEARLVKTRTTITSVSNKDTLSLTVNNLELNTTYDLTWYYRVDADTNERHMVPVPNSAGLPGSITTTNANSASAQYTNIAVGKDISLTDANNLIYYSVVINKHGDLAELTESNKVSWIWSTGNTAIKLPSAAASLGSSGIIALPITSDNNVVYLNGVASQLELNKLYKTEWYVTLPGNTEALIVNSGDSFAESGSTTHPLTTVQYIIPKTVSDGSISFRLFVYQNDNKSQIYDSSTIGVTVNPAPTVAIPKPSIAIIVTSTEPDPITSAGGRVYVYAHVTGLVTNENYDLVWNFKKPTLSTITTLSGTTIPTTIDATSQSAAIYDKKIYIDFNTGSMSLGTSVTALLANIDLTVTQRSNTANFNTVGYTFSVEPAPTIVQLAISDKSSSVNTLSIENKSFSTTLSVTVDGIVTGRQYAVMWKYKLPLENTERTLSTNKSFIVPIGGSGTATDTYSILDIGPNAGTLTLKPYVYEVINNALGTTALATDSIYVELTLPVPNISLSLYSTTPSTGINTATTNASVKIQAVLGKLVPGKNYTLSWKVKYPNDIDLKDLPSSNNTNISAVTADKTVVTTFGLTNTSTQGDVIFYGIITQVGNTSNTNTDNTSVNISDYLVPTPNITNVNVGRQNTDIDGWYLNATDLGINMTADVSNLVLNEIYDYKWEAITPAPAGSVPSVNTVTVVTGTITGKGPNINYSVSDSGSVNLGKILGTFTLKLTLTSRTVTTSTGYGRVNNTIIAKPIGKPDVSGVTSNITTFTEGSIVSDMTVSCNVKGLTSGDDYYLGFYYKLSGDSSERQIGSLTTLTGSDPTNNTPYTSSKIPSFNTNANTSIDVSARVYNSKTNSIRDDKTTNYPILTIGTPTLSEITSTKITYNTNETFNATLTATAGSLINAEKYNVKWEAIVNGTAVAVSGGTTTVTASGTTASLNASVSGILTGNNPNGTVVYKLTITSQANVNKTAYKDITYGITNPTTPTISNITTSPATFTPGTTARSVTLGATLGSLIAGKTYTVTWWYKTNTMGDFSSVGSNSLGLTSDSPPPTCSGSFVPGTNTDVTFKAVISIDGATNIITTPAISNPLPITDGSTGGGGTTTVNKATVGNLTSSETGLKLTQPFSTKLSSNVTNLSVGVTYTCEWYYKIDGGARGPLLGTTYVSSTTPGNPNATLNTPLITVDYITPGNTNARTIAFELVVSATGAQTATAIGGQTNVNYSSSGTGTILTPVVTSFVATNAPFTAPIFSPSLTLGINGNSLTPNTSYSVTMEYTTNGGTDWYTKGITSGTNIYLNSAVSGTYNHPITLQSVSAAAGSIEFRATITQGSNINITKLSDSSYTINAAGGTPTPSLSFDTTNPATTAGTTGNSYSKAITLVVANVPVGSSINLSQGDTNNGNQTITHTGASQYTITCTGSYPSSTTTRQVTASWSSYSATATLTINVTSGGTGGSVTINSLTATNTDTFKQSTTQGQGFSPKLTLSVSGLTPNTPYTLNWYLTYDGDTQPTPVVTLKDDADPTNITAATIINTSSTSVTKNVTIDPIITTKTGVKFKVIIGTASKETTSYPITPGSTGGESGLKIVLAITGTSFTNAQNVKGTVAVTGANASADYTYFIEVKNTSTNSWDAQTWKGDINCLTLQNGDFYIFTPPPLGAIRNANIDAYARNPTTTEISKTIRVTMVHLGVKTPSNEVTFTIGKGGTAAGGLIVDPATMIIRTGTSTPATSTDSIFDVYWGETFYVGAQVSNAMVNNDYSWTVGTTNDTTAQAIPADINKWDYGTDIWNPTGTGTTTNPLEATTGNYKTDAQADFTIDGIPLQNQWNSGNKVRPPGGSPIDDNTFMDVKGIVLLRNDKTSGVAVSTVATLRFHQRPRSGPVVTNYTPIVTPALWLDRAAINVIPGSPVYLYWGETGSFNIQVDNAKPETQLYYLFNYHLINNGTDSGYYYDSVFAGNGSTDINAVSKILIGTTDVNGHLVTGNFTITNPFNSGNKMPGVADGADQWLFISIKVMESDGSNIGTSQEFQIRLQQANYS